MSLLTDWVKTNGGGTELIIEIKETESAVTLSRLFLFLVR